MGRSEPHCSCNLLMIEILFLSPTIFFAQPESGDVVIRYLLIWCWERTVHNLSNCFEFITIAPEVGIIESSKNTCFMGLNGRFQ